MVELLTIVYWDNPDKINDRKYRLEVEHNANDFCFVILLYQPIDNFLIVRSDKLCRLIKVHTVNL